MRFFYIRQVLAFLSLFLVCNSLNAQVEIKGKVLDANTGEVLPFAVIVVKGTSNGTQTEFDGTFLLKVPKLPVLLNVSLVGFESKELEVTSAETSVVIKLGDKLVLIGDGTEQVVITGQRISDKQKSDPRTVETLDQIAIRSATSASFYDEVGKQKGVDLTTASIGFTIINTRGFNSTSPVRSLQIIDGVDNQSPGLNFSLGNFLGSSELDVKKLDLVVGAQSAYYGPNAFNGVISMETKNPFFQKGLSVLMKTGERNLVETGIRWADALSNKQGKSFLAYKFNVSYLRASDWEAKNYAPVQGTRTALFDPKVNPGRRDAVNSYGDEYDAGMDFRNSLYTDLGLFTFHRRGYNEIDLVDYSTRNLKVNAAVHLRLQPNLEENSPELIYALNIGNGTTVYQGDNRFSLKNIFFMQNRVELRKEGKYFLRFYETHEDAGDSFDPYSTALLLLQQSKTNEQWKNEYYRYWIGFKPNQGDVENKIQSMGYPNPFTDRAGAEKWMMDHIDFLNYQHNQAARYADSISGALNGVSFYEPGTERFQTQFNRITSTKSNNRNKDTGGTLFYDRSALYHGHGEYKWSTRYLHEITMGANARLYRPKTDGTIFADTNGRVIRNFEWGVYAGVEKRLDSTRWKINATVRLDKNQNYDYLLSPAASVVYHPDKLNFLRLSFSSAIRNPTLADQYLSLNVGRAILSGNITGQKDMYPLTQFADFVTGSPNYQKYKKLQTYKFNLAAIKPEKVKTIEGGYRTTLFDKVFMDLNAYYSFYTDFIGYKIGIKADLSDTLLYLPKEVQAYRFATNSSQLVTTAGASIGFNYYFAKNYQVSANYSWNQLQTAVNDSIIPAFNTPKHKFNLGISGREIRHFGFSLNYKWIEGFVFEGSPQFTGYVPTYGLLDGQVNYNVPKWNTTFKLGVSNMLQNWHYETYGGPLIGRLAYMTIIYELKK